jgi:outer membrane immunogenic protein
MRSIIAFALTAFTTSAIAADLPVKAPPPAAPAPVYMWTGCYIGGNLGWAQLSAHLNDRFDGNDGQLSSSSFAGGGQIGCDYQFASNWVFGVRGLIDGTDINRNRASILDPTVITFHTRANWFATVTARLGYLFTPTFLFYVNGGWGTVNERFSVNRTVDNFVIASADRNASGGDVGVGFEYMFAPNWTLWVEWDHIFLDHNSIEFLDRTVDRFDNINRNFDKVLFGINWRFGQPGAPVAARY